MRTRPTFEMIQEACEQLRGVTRNTELLPVSRSLTEKPVWLKSENNQRTGSFKIRGAYNRLAALTPEERARGVVCASAGNHAQGVALAGKLLGIRTTVVMPEGAPLAKLTATRAYGAHVLQQGHSFDEAQRTALALAEETGSPFIPAFDDAHVIAGQGTVALEILETLPTCDTVVVPIGGGGLAAGIALAVKTMAPNVRVIGAEPEGAATMQASLTAGRPTAWPRVNTLADGVAVGCPGELTFALCHEYLDDLVTVSEGELCTAMLQMLERMKTVAEGAGAVAPAAVLSGRAGGENTVCILSGGNVDVNTLKHIVDKGLASAGRRGVLSVVVKDRPGALSDVLKLVADTGGNVLSLEHTRRNAALALGEVLITLDVETEDATHTAALRQVLGQRAVAVL